MLDSESKESFSINFSGFAVQRDNSNCCQGVIKLYSNKKLDNFISAYENKFGNPDSFNCLTKNCSSPVDFALDYFFPQKACLDATCIVYKLLCCWGFLGTLGMSCFPAPPGISMPSDVYNKARMLSCRYGQPYEKVQTTLAETEDTRLIKKGSSDKCVGNA